MHTAGRLDERAELASNGRDAVAELEPTSGSTTTGQAAESAYYCFAVTPSGRVIVGQVAGGYTRWRTATSRRRSRSTAASGSRIASKSSPAGRA
jgi:hypothetical protein